MPQYRFPGQVFQRIQRIQRCATLEGAEAAWKEAAAMCADLARDIMSAEPEWLLEVTDEAGQALFKFQFAAESLVRKVGADTLALSPD